MLSGLRRDGGAEKGGDGRLSSFLDSGVGAGIDSYYEYCLKSYILLGDDEFLQRFAKVSV